MKITVIGASAGIGLAVVRQALQRGHQVTALSRSGLPQLGPNLTEVRGIATNKADLQGVLAQAEAVLVTLGTGKSTKPTTLYSDFARLLIQLNQQTPLLVPVIIVTGFGAGESGRYQGSLLLKLAFRFLLRDVYADKTKMEELITASPLRWIIVRPGLLTDKPLTGTYRVETKLYEGVDIGSISRAEVAEFLLEQAEHPTYEGQYPALSTA